MKIIIFDLGRVLIKWDPDVVYKKYFANDLAKISRFYEETNIWKTNAEMDCGRSFHEALTELSSKFPSYREPIHLWQSQWLEMIGGPIEDSVKILKSLHAQGYPLYALTNWAKETFFPHIRHNPTYTFLNNFNDIIVSGVERIIKPNPEIYKLLLQRHQLNPKNCIFIDDSQDNLVPAQNLGMATIKFTSPAQLIKELESHSVSVIRF
ncbi:MAG: HAD hydrolase, family IA [uncultured bacterium]|nr:MAG: HAD hydrolase, family IA [uncultured bacterium]